MFPACRDATVDDQEDHYQQQAASSPPCRRECGRGRHIAPPGESMTLRRRRQRQKRRIGSRWEAGCIFHVPEYLAEFDQEWMGRTCVRDVGYPFVLLFLPLGCPVGPISSMSTCISGDVGWGHLIGTWDFVWITLTSQSSLLIQKIMCLMCVNV